MNKSTQREVNKIAALPTVNGMTAPEHAAYAARSLTALHRAAGPKVQRELEEVIDRLGLWNVIRTTNGVLTAL